MNVNLKTALPYAGNVGSRTGVPLLRDQLKRSLETERAVQIHQPATIFEPTCRFDVVGDDCTTQILLWPEPNEGKGFAMISLHYQHQQMFENTVHGGVHWPTWEWQLLPSA